TLARPEVEFAHPLDGGRAAVVSRSVTETAARLGADGRAYRRLLGPLTSHMDDVLDAILAPLRTLPAHPLHAANYGRRAILPAARAVLLDVSPRALAQLAGDKLPRRYLAALRRFRYGPGVCKVDFALSGPVPWTSEPCRKAGTLHLGGPFEQVAAAEAEVAAGKHPERPYVLVVQPGVADPSRAPAGQQTLWTYCHVPAG